METLDLILKIWPILILIGASILGVVIWSTRVEGRMLALEKRLDELSEHSEQLILLTNAITEFRSDLKWMREKVDGIFDHLFKQHS